MKNKSKLLFYIFTIAAFIFVVYYFSAIKKDISLIKEVNVFWLTASILAQLATYLFTALIYNGLIKMFQINSQVTVCQLYQASIIALFANQVVPFAGISGNVFFFNFLRHAKISVQNIFTIVIVELFTFYVAAEIIILFILLFSFIFFKLKELFLIILIAGFLIYMLFAFGVAFIGKKKTINRLVTKLKKIKLIRKYAEKLERLIQENNQHIQSGIPLILKNKSKTALLSIFQIAIFLCDGITICALFNGLGISVPFENVFMALILTKIISLLPLSPGALILYESSMTFFLTKFGAPLGAAVIVTLLFRVLSFWLPMPIGFLLSGKFRFGYSFH